jgi:hypothetical protein
VVGAVRQDVVTVGRYIEDTVTFDFELHPETMVRAHGSAGAREGKENRIILYVENNCMLSYSSSRLCGFKGHVCVL